MMWNTALIADDKAILEEYGLRRKREIWSAKAVVSDFRRRARELNAVKDNEKERVLLEKINKLGLIKANTLDDVLSLELKSILNRRLQTLVKAKGFAATSKQARQLITHGHITINGRKTKTPSYIVPLSEEDAIGILIDVKKLSPPVVEKQQKTEGENKESDVEAVSE